MLLLQQLWFMRLNKLDSVIAKKGVEWGAQITPVEPKDNQPMHLNGQVECQGKKNHLNLSANM